MFVNSSVVRFIRQSVSFYCFLTAAFQDVSYTDFSLALYPLNASFVRFVKLLPHTNNGFILYPVIVISEKEYYS